MPNVQLYTKEDISSLRWPDSEWNRLCRKLIEPFVLHTPGHYIDNVDTCMMALKVDQYVLPVTKSESVDHNAYVCSPYNHYVSYGQEELDAVAGSYMRPFLKLGLKALGGVLAYGSVDKLIAVNNWLLPTNLYPNLTREQIDVITKTLVGRYPDYTIAFRSVNPHAPPGLLDSFQSLGFLTIPYRMIYLTPTETSAALKSRMFKSDLKLMQQSTYRPVDKTEELKKQMARIKELHRVLNIEKYSKYNPQYNDNFMSLAMETGWLKFIGFEEKGRLDAVLGYFSTGGVMTSPLFGYDLSLHEKGLYRLLSTELLLKAAEGKMFLNQSAGAGHYKKLRRAEECVEYLAIYHKHLPLRRRLPWNILNFAIRSFGMNLMSKC